MRIVLGIVIVLVAMAASAPAWADPCGAIPNRKPAPAWVKPGARFSGTVRYIIDGDGFCVGQHSDPATWIEVRMVDFDAPELNQPGGANAKRVMGRIAAGRWATCTVRRGRRGTVVTYDRVLAECWIGRKRLAAELRATGVIEGGK